jgi:outer membrane lipoprotein-sorting protein
MKILTATCGFFIAAVAASAGETPDIVEMLRGASNHYEKVSDYTATFHKQQRVGGVLYDEEKILVKFRKPFKVYMKWIGPAENGREVLYMEGKNNNKLLVQPGGAWGYFTPAFSIDPESGIAMRKNLRPVTESGIGNTIKLLLEVCLKAQRSGDLTVRYKGEGKIGDRPTHRFERLLPLGKGYPAHRSIIELDKETGFPLSITSYGWKGELLEKYLYEDLCINAGLTEKDYDRGNSEYRFGRFTVPL